MTGPNCDMILKWEEITELEQRLDASLWKNALRWNNNLMIGVTSGKKAELMQCLFAATPFFLPFD
jgi:hypothetical protein